MKTAIALGLICAAGIAAAKEGVQNPAVKARMDAMQVIKTHTGVIADMTAGKTAFDSARAAEAAAALAATAATIPALFEAEEEDPASEARDEIWMMPEDFNAKAEALYKAALAIDASSLDAMRPSMATVGSACKACHDDYRM